MRDATLVLDFISRNGKVSPAHFDSLGLTRKRLSAVLRKLCDEEKICISDGMVHINNG